MKVSKSGYNVTPLTQAQRDELASKVDANTRHIALESGTERAFTGKTVNGEASLNSAFAQKPYMQHLGTRNPTCAGKQQIPDLLLRERLPTSAPFLIQEAGHCVLMPLCHIHAQGTPMTIRSRACT